MNPDQAGEGQASFGALLRSLREAHGLSLRELGRRTYYSSGHLGRVERDDKEATVEVAQACAPVVGEQLLDHLYRLQQDTQAVTTTLAQPAQLPPVGALYGREHECDSLTDAARSPAAGSGQPRVLALDGPPGAGKTSLALAWGHHVADDYPDGQLFIDLCGWDPHQPPADPGNVQEEFLRGLGVSTALIPSGPERERLWHSTTRGLRLLLLLDNAHDAQQVTPLLPASTHATVVVTSRVRLSGLVVRSAATRVPVGPLQANAARALLASVIGHQRVQSEPRAAEQLVRRCDYLPIGVQLVAEQVATRPHHTLTELAGELGALTQRLDVLDAAGQGALRASFDWSYRDLHPEEAAVFRTLGLHPTAELATDAAAALSGEHVVSTRRSLERLAAAHLVEEIDRDRWRLHDLLRVYAAEQSERDDPPLQRQHAVLRLLEWYLHTAAAANQQLAPQQILPSLPARSTHTSPSTISGHRQALDWCAVEARTLVFAGALAREYGWPQLAWRLPATLLPYCTLSKHWSAWITGHQHGYAAAHAAGDRHGQAWCQHNLGVAYMQLRRWQEALECLDDAIRLRRELDETSELGWSLLVAGQAALERGLPGEAEQQLRHALSLFEQHDVGRGYVLACLGTALRRQNDPHAALAWLREAEQICRSLGGIDAEPFALTRLAATYTALGQAEQALECADRAVELRRRHQDQWGHAEAQLSRGHALLLAGRAEQARAAWQHAVQTFDELRDPHAQDARAALAELDDESDEDEWSLPAPSQ